MAHATLPDTVPRSEREAARTLDVRDAMPERDGAPVAGGGTPDALAAAHAKESHLAAWLARRGSVLVGFSGGVDSTYLAAVATATLGAERVLAVLGRSPSLSAEQGAAAHAAAQRLGLSVLEVDTHELADPRYAANPSNRCYFCKHELWSVLGRLAAERGIGTVVDGTNAEDLGDHRPGMRAAAEHGVASPLADVGLTKREIRWLSRSRGLPTWAQPSSPCLASRLPYGTAVTPERLRAVERAEAALRSLGVTGDLRVRHHGDLARVELGAAELERWLAPEARARVRVALREAGFARAALDLRGFRSGSLNVLGSVA